MAHFMGDMQGTKGTVNRLGTAQSGIRAHIRGWNFGVQMELFVDTDGKDTVRLIPTGGSNDPGIIGRTIILKRSDFKGG